MPSFRSGAPHVAQPQRGSPDHAPGPIKRAAAHVKSRLRQVRAKDDQAALAHGKAELGGPLPEKEQRDLLSDALTLLCYEDPAASPQGALMVPAARATLADDVDAVLLAARQRPQQSVLEQLYCSLVREPPAWLCLLHCAGCLMLAGEQQSAVTCHGQSLVMHRGRPCSRGV